MIGKTLVAIMAFLALGFAAAPTWVAYGMYVKYTVGTDTIGFTVVNRTADEIRIEIKPASTTEFSWATENVTGTYGQFWFDSSLLTDASIGDKIGDFTVTDTGSETYAGRDWDTVTLQATISDAKTTRVYDRDSGLMLKQSVDVTGAPLVTLMQYNIPSLANYIAPPPTTLPPEETATANGTTTTPVQENVTPTSETSGTSNETVSQGTGTQGEPTSPNEQSSGGCGGAVFILGMLGAGAWIRSRA